MTDDLPGDIKIQLIAQGIGDTKLSFSERVELRTWLDELVKLAGDAISEVANLRQAYSTHTYNHPDDDMRILTLDMSEALIHRGRKVLGWDKADV